MEETCPEPIVLLEHPGRAALVAGRENIVHGRYPDPRPCPEDEFMDNVQHEPAVSALVVADESPVTAPERYFGEPGRSEHVPETRFVACGDKEIDVVGRGEQRVFSSEDAPFDSGLVECVHRRAQTRPDESVGLAPRRNSSHPGSISP